MVGTILGAGMGLAGTIASMNSQEKAMNDQWRLEQEKMALQAKYNIALAAWLSGGNNDNPY